MHSHCTVERLAPRSLCMHSENLSRLGYIPLLFLAGGRVGEGGGDTDLYLSSDTTVGAFPFIAGTGGLRELELTFLVTADCFFKPEKQMKLSPYVVC